MGEGGRGKYKTVRGCQKKKSKSDLVCGFEGGPVEIIFILKVEGLVITTNMVSLGFGFG